MNLNAFIPPAFAARSYDDPQHTITRKRMERFTPNGQLLSVTDVKTTHFDDNPTTYSTRQLSNNRNEYSTVDHDYHTVHTYSTVNPPPREEKRKEPPYYRIPRPAVEREYPIKQIDRVIPHEIIREYKNEHPTASSGTDWKTTDSYIRKTSILKSTKPPVPAPQPPRQYFETQQRVEWREPLDCLIDRMNRIRASLAFRPLQPSVRLADIAAQWARMLALRGEFKSDRDRLMNIWMGTRVNETIADIWWDEAEEYGTQNYMDENNLSWVGVASAFSEQHRQFIVVAVYE